MRTAGPRALPPRSLAALRLWAIVACLCLSCSGSSRPDAPTRSEITTTAGGVRSFRGATLDLSGPLPVLELVGTPYEQGFAYGVLLTDELSAVYAQFAQLMDVGFTRLPWYQRFLARRRLDAFARGFEQRTPPRYVDEMRGLADGAGLDYDDVLTVSSGGVLLMACTSVLAADGEHGSFLHGRNFDFRPTFLGEHPVLVRHASAGDVASWNLSVIGYLPSFHGANDAGLSVSLNASDRNEAEPNGLPMGWKLRELLSRASSLDEARRVVHGSPNDDLDWIVVVGSARERRGSVFDLKGEIQAETTLEAGRPLVVLNRPFGDGRHVDDGLAAKHLDVVQQHDPFNVLRWATAERLLAERPLGGADDMWRLLRDHGGLAPGAFFSEGTIANQATLFSVVFELGEGRLSFATGTSWAPLRQVWSFDLATRRFAPLLPADALVTSPGFLEKERRYLALERARLSGTLDVAAITADLEPLMLIEYGMLVADLDRPDAGLVALLERAAAAHPELTSLAMNLGYILKQAEPARAVAVYAEALRASALNPVHRLYALKHLANAHDTLGNKAEATATARRWLAEEAALTAELQENTYLRETRARMLELVEAD